jgi:repressor LexA
MLTRRQKDLLDFIAMYMSDHDGISPSFDEMKIALGVKSKSVIHNHLVALEKRGVVRRFPKCARSIEIVRPPAPTPRPSHERDVKLGQAVWRMREFLPPSLRSTIFDEAGVDFD